MPVIPFIPAIIGAGAALGAAKMASNASNNATEAQTQAADDSLALTKEMYEQDRADYAPYRNLGAFSTGQLGHLVGMPQNFGTDMAAQVAAPESGVAQAAPAATSRNIGHMPGNIPPRGEPPMENRSLLPLQNLSAQQQTASSFVKMQAPTGETREVPADQVEFYLGRGARRIG